MNIKHACLVSYFRLIDFYRAIKGVLFTGDLEPTFQHCCELGTVVAAQNQKCDEVTSGTPVQGVAAEQQSICLSTMLLCCVRTLR